MLLGLIAVGTVVKAYMDSTCLAIQRVGDGYAVAKLLVLSIAVTAMSLLPLVTSCTALSSLVVTSFTALSSLVVTSCTALSQNACRSLPYDTSYSRRRLDIQYVPEG
jgi:hypothetical protein